jgi:prepilin-type N-terminal cleavage/methylation domain-containing protein
MGYFSLKKKKGFTLVEMMVAIAVFSLVMVAAMSALLNVIDANAKARAIKSAINNISFALDGISKDMRMGTDYACGTLSVVSEPVSKDCSDGNTDIIKYRSHRAYYNSGTGEYGYAYYKFAANQIWECLEKSGVSCASAASPTYYPVTSLDVKLNKVTFYVLGVTDSTRAEGNGKTQPRMIITVSGEAGIKEKVKTTFDLQTSISQRTKTQI